MNALDVGGWLNALVPQSWHDSAMSHRIPQSPQFVGSDDVSLHFVPHAVSAASLHVQAPALQDCRLEHACPHEPQFQVPSYKL